MLQEFSLGDVEEFFDLPAAGQMHKIRAILRQHATSLDEDSFRIMERAFLGKTYKVRDILVAIEDVPRFQRKLEDALDGVRAAKLQLAQELAGALSIIKMNVRNFTKQSSCEKRATLEQVARRRLQDRFGRDAAAIFAWIFGNASSGYYDLALALSNLQRFDKIALKAAKEVRAR